MTEHAVQNGKVVEYTIDLSRYVDQPREVSFETYAKCNAACTFCPYPTLDRIDAKMSWALIDKYIEEMSDWTIPYFLCPFKVNEPYLDKRIFDICKKATDNTLAVIRLFTNGSTLTDKNIGRTAEIERMPQLNISLNEWRPEQYKNLMSLDFDRTTRNIDALHKSEPGYEVILSTVGFPNDAFKQYCLRRWPRFVPIVLRDGGWLGFSDVSYEIPNTSCGRWFELSIMANGIASLCCVDGEGKYGLGDTNTETLLEIYAKTRPWRTTPDFRRTQAGDPCNRCWN